MFGATRHTAMGLVVPSNVNRQLHHSPREKQLYTLVQSSRLRGMPDMKKYLLREVCLIRMIRKRCVHAKPYHIHEEHQIRSKLPGGKVNPRRFEETISQVYIEARTDCAYIDEHEHQHVLGATGMHPQWP